MSDLLGGASGKVLSNEIEDFEKEFEKFLKKVKASNDQESFSTLVKSLSSSMSSLALKSGIMYPTELSNLVETFVPVRGTYAPHNSKLVIVDMVKRLDNLERSSSWQRGVGFSVLLTFFGSILYVPFLLHKLELKDKSLDEKIADLQKKVKVMDETVHSLSKSSERVDVLEKRVDSLGTSADSESNRALEATATGNEEVVVGNWTTATAGCIVGTLGALLLYIWSK